MPPTGGLSGFRFMRMRGDGEGLLSGAARQLSRIKLPFNAPSLVDRSKPYFSGIKRFGISKFSHYWQDPFHTLLNLPWGRFIAIFFLTYLLEFMVFAFLFWVQSNHCVIGMHGKFSHALWMSSRTASTLGFNEIQPNPECPLTNLTVMLQVIFSSLINFIMLGLVFARFSAPFKRASTIRFSAIMTCNRHPSGYWALGLRVANIRKHQLLKPSLRMVVTAVDSITPSNYLFEHLAIEGLATQETNLELGFPANVTHVIGPTSPLFNLSLLEMDTRMMEVLVFVDGIDAMTSKNMTARHAYNTNEVRMNEQFVPLHLEVRGREMGLDFTNFDGTSLASAQLLSEYNADPSLAERPLPEVQSHMWHLRHMTFRRLAERDHALGHGPRTGEAAAGPAGPSLSIGAAQPEPGPGRGPAPHPGPGVPSAAATLFPPSFGRPESPSPSQGNTPLANPFAGMGSASATSAGASGGGGGAGGGSSWMGFGVSLQPAQGPQPALPQQPYPISAYLGSGALTGGSSGLESFADLQAHGAVRPGGFATHGSAPQQQPQQQYHQQQPHAGHGGRPANGAAGLARGSGGSGGGLEMLPTSLPAVEPRANGTPGLPPVAPR